MSQKPKINPNAGHRARLKERLLKDSKSLGDYELIELLLGYVYSRQDTKPLAKELLGHFGSLRGLFNAKFHDLEKFAQTKKAIVVTIILFKELMTRYTEAPVTLRDKIQKAEDIADMARMRLGNLEQEECWLALVDTQNKLIAWEMISRGQIDRLSIQPRDIFTITLKYKCAGFILLHNHPSGSTKASTPDLELTNKVRELSQMMGIHFIDHIIVTEKECYSFNERRLFK